MTESARATSFGSAAEDYAAYRPAPSDEAASWAIGDRQTLVVDLAAGTGNLSQHLVEHSNLVIAADIDPRMLRVLGRKVRPAERVVARGEVLPFRQGSVDAVAISSAWHWLDHERAWPELARVLRPGGFLGVVGSGPDRTVPWVAAVFDEYRDQGADRPDRRRRWQTEIPEGVPFRDAEERTFTSSVRYAVADLPGLVASYSRVIVLPADQRRDVVAAVAARASSHPALAGLDTVDLPLRSRVWRAVRDSDR